MTRVVLSGAESVGKSRLAAWLAARFGGTLVEEFGRGYCEALDRPWTPADLSAIAEGHARAARAGEAATLLVEDTDIVMTDAWARMTFGAPQPDLAARPSAPALHLLLLPDVPFEPDPVRVHGDPAARARFHALIVESFADRRLPFCPIGGGWAARERRAASLVAEWMR